MSELWKPIDRYPAYDVSNLGRVRRVAGYRCPTDRILKMHINPAGYPTVLLYDNGQRTRALVHQLVCAAFIGPKPSPSHQVGHRDGSRSNNAAANLRWVTAKENAADRTLHGNSTCGERNGLAKLTESDVRAIRASALSQRRLARQYGIAQTNVSAIKRRETWAHVGSAAIERISVLDRGPQ